MLLQRRKWTQTRILNDACQNRSEFLNFIAKTRAVQMVFEKVEQTQTSSETIHTAPVTVECNISNHHQSEVSEMTNGCNIYTCTMV